MGIKPFLTLLLFEKSTSLLSSVYSNRYMSTQCFIFLPYRQKFSFQAVFQIQQYILEMWYFPSKHLQSFQFAVICSFHVYSFSSIVWVLIKKYWLELGPRQTFDLKSNFSLIVCEFLNVFFNYSNSLLLSSSSGCYPLWIIPCFITSLKNICSLFFPLYPSSLGCSFDFKQPVEVDCRYAGWLCSWWLCVVVFLGAGDCVSSKLGSQE